MRGFSASVVERRMHLAGPYISDECHGLIEPTSMAVPANGVPSMSIGTK